MTTIAVLEPQSLLGQEVREGLERLPVAPTEVRLLTRDEEAVGTVSEVLGAAALVRGREQGCLEGVDLVFACGEPGYESAFADDLPESASLVLVGAAVPAATAAPYVAGVSGDGPAGGVWSSPHAAVVLLALLLAPLADLGLEEAVAHVTLPGSTRGKKGIDEILDQVRAILTFSGEKHEEVFGAQIAFNLLPSEQPEAVLLDQLDAVLAGASGGKETPSVSLRLSHAGVFHSLGAQVRIRLGRRTTPEELRDLLTSRPLIESAEDPGRLGPIDVAGRSEVLLGPIDPDGDDGRTWWVTAVMDNLTRGGAWNALDVAGSLL